MAHYNIVLLTYLLTYDIMLLFDAGLSDPYVVVELQPCHLFPDQQPQQTSVVKRTLNPAFNETFSLYVVTYSRSRSRVRPYAGDANFCDQWSRRLSVCPSRDITRIRCVKNVQTDRGPVEKTFENQATLT